MGNPVPVTQLPVTITSNLSQSQLLTALQMNFQALVQGLQATQGYCNNSVAPVINLSTQANSEILGSQIAGFARPSVAVTEEGVQVQTHIPRYEQEDTDDFYYGLLMEEGTTNIALYSQQFSNAVWNNAGTIAVTDNTTVAPDGSTTAATLAGSIAGAYRYQELSTGNPVGQTYSFSVWLKAPTACTCYIGWSSYYISAAWSPALSVTTIWQRFSFTYTFTAGQTGNATPLIQMGTNTINTWGAQAELKAYSTSYMATTSATATRSPESMIIPTAGVFKPGMWTVEVRYTPKDTVSVNYLMLWQLLIDGNNYYQIYVDSTGALHANVASGGTNCVISTSAGYMSVGTQYSIMFTGNGTNITLCCNGVQIGSIPYVEAVGTRPAWMYLGCNYTAVYQVNGIIDDLCFSNTAHTITDHQNYISSNQPHPVQGDTTLLMEFDQTLRQTSVQRLTNIQGTFVIADALTTSDSSKATHIVPTGWTTAEATIMQAMSELLATGGSIVLLDGSFFIDLQINMLISSIVLAGQSTSTFIIANNAMTYMIGDNGAAVSGIAISNLTLEGQTSYGSYGIGFTAAPSPTISTVSVQRCSYGGIYLSGITTGAITNCAITNNGSPHGGFPQLGGICLFNTKSCSISGNSVTGNYIGINSNTDSYSTITNNTVSNSTYDGIYLFGSVHETISGNASQGNGQIGSGTYGNISVHSGSNHNNIQGNTCRSAAAPTRQPLQFHTDSEILEAFDEYYGATLSPSYGIWIGDNTCTSNLVTSNDCYTGGTSAGISDAGTSTNFGSGNRVNSGSWSTIPS